jgi:drug/metabolite transporter (DMT)-like permease
LLTNLILNLSVLLLGGFGGGGGHHSIKGDEIAGIGLGAAALVGAVGYLVLRRRSSKQK